MERERLLELLRGVAAGDVSPEDAHECVARLPYLDLGAARLDLDREHRTGLPEVVFAQGKSDDELVRIVEAMVADSGRVLVTRVEAAAAEVLSASISDARFEARARIWCVGRFGPSSGRRVAVLSAGTSDFPVAEEAASCSEWLGHEVERIRDVGVAGIQRALDSIDSLRRADVAVVVAGMDGALPTVVAGLVSCPVIAVPTSVGYGASFAGVGPLLTMLTACAPGIAVVNIDNGFGAAALAHRILSTSIASPYE
ncbi:MAG: nickel pincer cofactor biosynthesis protein LarB [Holophagales bacterium]|nr:nickel pincer cofactor biosynthesis protein LarB [Holophagales bacterium]MYJ25134.1 nickel pincer cofactor biosynthesis protein LarB [Holophagales bacterium]